MISGLFLNDSFVSEAFFFKSVLILHASLKRRHSRFLPTDVLFLRPPDPVCQSYCLSSHLQGFLHGKASCGLLTPCWTSSSWPDRPLKKYWSALSPCIPLSLTWCVFEPEEATQPEARSSAGLEVGRGEGMPGLLTRQVGVAEFKEPPWTSTSAVEQLVITYISRLYNISDI